MIFSSFENFQTSDSLRGMESNNFIERYTINSSRVSKIECSKGDIFKSLRPEIQVWVADQRIVFWKPDSVDIALDARVSIHIDSILNGQCSTKLVPKGVCEDCIAHVGYSVHAHDAVSRQCIHGKTSVKYHRPVNSAAGAGAESVVHQLGERSAVDGCGVYTHIFIHCDVAKESTRF